MPIAERLDYTKLNKRSETTVNSITFDETSAFNDRLIINLKINLKILANSWNKFTVRRKVPNARRIFTNPRASHVTALTLRMVRCKVIVIGGSSKLAAVGLGS